MKIGGRLSQSKTPGLAKALTRDRGDSIVEVDDDGDSSGSVSEDDESPSPKAKGTNFKIVEPKTGVKLETVRSVSIEEKSQSGYSPSRKFIGGPSRVSNRKASGEQKLRYPIQ